MIEVKLVDVIWISVIVLSPIIILIRKLKSNGKKDSFYSQIKTMREQYRGYTKERQAAFDKDLEGVLIENEAKGNKLANDISAEILYALIDMSKYNEAKRQFNAIQASNPLTHSLCTLMLSFLIKEQETRNDDSIVIIKQCLKSLKWDIMNLSQLEDAICCAAIANEFKLIDTLFNNDKYNLIKDVSSCTIEFVLLILNAIGKAKQIISLYTHLALHQMKSAASLEIITQAFIIENRPDLINEFTPELFTVMNETTLYNILDVYTRNMNMSKAESVYSLIKDQGNVVIGAGKMMTMYSRTKKYTKLIEVFHTLTAPTIVHYQLALKTLFQTKQIDLGFEVFDRLMVDKNCIIDKGIYELVIKACFDFKFVAKAYELLLESIYSNIKLSKYIYEEMIVQLDASDVIGRQKMIVNLYDIFKISNMSSNAGLMAKVKGLLEKDVSTSSYDTNDSSYVREIDQSI